MVCIYENEATVYLNHVNKFNSACIQTKHTIKYSSIIIIMQCVSYSYKTIYDKLCRMVLFSLNVFGMCLPLAANARVR